ncbi:MAG: flagellar basal-body rod protein FlgG [Candidatus Marinimicrobia bacterium]|nr:flagellar basal-body rod protein FlgG [Candidatus Neomarinimicrobiota bacterium]
MLRSLRTAALGMSAQQLTIDSISNNLANINTTAYKKNSVEFQDLLYQTVQSGGAEGRNDKMKPGEIQIGLGNKPVSTFRSFTQGAINETGNPLDLAINGKGFFQIMKADGGMAFTRDGAFRVNNMGEIVNINGQVMYPEISVPDNVTGLQISEDGVINATIEGQVDVEELGQIEVVSFMNPAGLKAMGGNLYEETEASGQPVFGVPGEDSLGSIAQGYLEQSNVDVVSEMINLIVAQRAYEINSKAIKTSDELLSITNSLKR